MIGLGLHGVDDAQIGGARGCGQRTGIGIADLREYGIGFIFGCKRPESQAIAGSSIFGDLDLVDVRVEDCW